MPRSDGAPDIRNMWDQPDLGYASSPAASPETEEDGYSIRAVASSVGADQHSGSGRSKTKEYPKIKPRSASKSMGKGSSDDDEAEELLSPRLGYR
jgi:hypothetical protein